MPSGTWKLVYVLVHLSTPLQTEKVEYTGVNVPSQCATIRLRTKKRNSTHRRARNTASAPFMHKLRMRNQSPGKLNCIARFGWYRKAIRAEDSWCSDNQLLKETFQHWTGESAEQEIMNKFYFTELQGLQSNTIQVKQILTAISIRRSCWGHHGKLGELAASDRI